MDAVSKSWGQLKVAQLGNRPRQSGFSAKALTSCSAALLCSLPAFQASNQCSSRLRRQMNLIPECSIILMTVADWR